MLSSELCLLETLAQHELVRVILYRKAHQMLLWSKHKVVKLHSRIDDCSASSFKLVVIGWND
jgi:hypothetical protein